MNKRVVSKFLLSLCSVGVANALAQTNENNEEEHSAKLEVIEVTSQRRVENIQDVPISVTALSAKQLERVSIDKIDDLQLYVPNLSLTETGLSTQTYIRGIGTGNNQGFEQSVVQFVDGISHARPQLSRAPFFDLERVEVLRGPQSILFGKNAIGGALNISTASVEEENSGRVFVQFGEYGTTELQGIINQELLEDKLYGRLSVRSYQDDGYIKNKTLNQDEPQRDDLTIRAKLKYLINTDWHINFKYERNEFDTIGRQIEVIQDQGNPGAPFGTTLATVFGLPNAITDTNLDYERDANGDTSYNEFDSYVFAVNGMFGDLTFESNTAFLTYELDEICDCDFIAAPIIGAPLYEEYDQFSQEFRIATPSDQTFSWQAGIFYQTSDMDYEDSIAIPVGAVGRPDLSVLPTAVFALTMNPVLGNAISGTSATRIFTQSSDAFSIFGQGDWKISDKLTLSVGARWVTEDKEATRSMNVTNTESGQPAPLGAAVLQSVFAIESEQTTGHNLSGDRSESSFDPSIKLQYFANDDLMFYGSWSKGSKSGGYDTRSNIVTSFEFEGEEASAFEAGFKSTFWDGRARFNAAAYYTDYDRLQVAQFDGRLGFVVGNADAEVKGLEIDGSLAVTEDLTLSYSAAYLDHEYTDYTNGNCYYAQQFDTENPDRAARFNPTTNLCDYTGLSGQYTPEFTGNINADYFVALTASADLHINLNYSYTGSQNVHQNLDPTFEVGSIGRVDVNIAIEFEDWGIEVLGRNITDQDYVTYANNSPLSGTFGADTIYGFIAPPSMWSLRGYYNF